MKIREKLIKVVESGITPYIVLVIMVFVLLSPIVLIISNSFKTEVEIYSGTPTVFPNEPTLDVYRKVTASPVPLTIRNSVIIAGGTTFFVLVAGIFTAYGLSKYRFRGSNFMLSFFLATRIIPPLSLLVPFYVLMSWLRALNTFSCLIIINTYMCYPLIVWMIKAFFDDLPRDLTDAALMDGCSRTGAFLRVALPLSAVGIAAAGIITFLWTWNEFLYAMILTSTYDVSPVTIGIFHFVGDEIMEWNSLSAVGVFTSLPAIVMFVIAQKYIVAGLTKGGLKF